MFDWIIDNKEWLFSGAGILVITSILTLLRFFKRRRNVKRQIIFKGYHKWARGDCPLRTEIFYPQPFDSTPNLTVLFPERRISPKGRRILPNTGSGHSRPVYELIEQRSDGFVIEIRSIGQFDPHLHWQARGASTG